MRASDLALLVALAAGCSSKSSEKVQDPPKAPNSFEDCTRFVQKAQPVIEEMTKKAGMPFGNGEVAAFVRECAASTAPREKLMDCVLAAADEPAVRSCYAAANPPAPP